MPPAEELYFIRSNWSFAFLYTLLPFSYSCYTAFLSSPSSRCQLYMCAGTKWLWLFRSWTWGQQHCSQMRWLIEVSILEPGRWVASSKSYPDAICTCGFSDFILHLAHLWGIHWVISVSWHLPHSLPKVSWLCFVAVVASANAFIFYWLQSHIICI
jgi:hypothetical protein